MFSEMKVFFLFENSLRTVNKVLEIKCSKINRNPLSILSEIIEEDLISNI